MSRPFKSLACLATLASLPAWAEGPAEVQGDIEYGAFLSSECLTCHRGDGAAGGIPPIVGWAAADFVLVMHDFKSGTREHQVMEMIARQLGDEEIASLAVYFESLGAASTGLD